MKRPEKNTTDLAASRSVSQSVSQSKMTQTTSGPPVQRVGRI